MKRVAPAAYPKAKPTHKSKSKAHSKSRDKKFNPHEYINSLIEEFHDHPFHTVRKRPPSTHRLERSSALAYTTPITERTISSSKVRSKSSYSQYRKKSIPMRDILRVDLDNVITDDNIIHFTEETIQSTELPPTTSLHPHHFLTPSAAARRIQRAWRKYQTLKVVRKYYTYYKNVMRQERAEREQAKEERSGERKRDLDRTLKIKKNHQSSFAHTARSHMDNAFKFEGSGVKTKELVREPSAAHEMLNQTKTVELPVLSQPQILLSEEYNSQDINFVIDLFRSKEENASREINSQLDTYCKIQAQLTPLECFTSNESELSPVTQKHHSTEGLSPAIFIEMERVIYSKYRLLGGRMGEGQEEQLEGRMRRQLRNLERCREDYMRSILQLKESMIQLQLDTHQVQQEEERQGRVASRVRKSFSAETLILRSILSEVTFKNIDLDFAPQRQHAPELLLEGSEQQRRDEVLQPICPTSPPSGLGVVVPSSQTEGSKGSLACYEFSDGERLQEQLYNESVVSFNEAASKRSFNEFDQQLVSMSNCESSSSIQISLKEEFEQSSSVAREDANTLLLRECAEEMQEKIENILIAEVVEELYTNPRVYSLFKPYIERPFEFKQITDFDILSFLQSELPSFIQSPERVFSRFNQKINPSSLQILRLIRDFDFEIDEYELVLPEEIFKAYRKAVEEAYCLKIREESEGRVEVGMLPLGVGVLVEERAGERRVRRGKFLSFQRDLKIMYMKAVFNCYNELIIETKSFYSYMNGRSSIGPGELTLALREYNWQCGREECEALLGEARGKVERIVRDKCMLPVFKNYKELEQFQKQMTKQISTELGENEYKWVNYMDEVLELWQDISLWVCEAVLTEAGEQIGRLLGVA